MAALNRGVAVPMGLPLRGKDLNQPLANMSELNSPWLLNVDCKNQSLAVRPGVKIHATINTDTTRIKQLGTYGVVSGEKLFAYVDDATSTHKVYDVSTSTPSLAHTLADDDAPDIYMARFSRLLAFVTITDPADCGVTYNGSAWSAWNFTNAGNPTGANIVCQYRGRVYLFSGTAMFYSDEVGATSGTLTLLQHVDVMDYADEFAWAAPFPISQQNTNDTLLAFGTSQGEVFVYGGTYPGSSTWSLVQKFKLDSMVGYNLSVFPYKNDLWLLTKTGIVSLRDILTSGVTEAYKNSPSFAINEYWTKLVDNLGNAIWNGNETQFSIVHWPEKNRILVSAPIHVDEFGVPDESLTILSYNTLTKAWSVYKLTTVNVSNFGGLTYFAGDIYFYSGNVVMKIDTTIFKDEQWNSAGTYSAYAYVVDGAYTDLGTKNKRKRVQAIQPILKTDFNGLNVGVKVTADMGRAESQTANVTLQDGYNLPYYSVGVEGSRVKYRIHGNTDTTSTDGLEIFDVDAVVTPSEGVR